MPVELNERLLRKVAKCALCEKGVGHTRAPIFYRVTVETVVLDVQAIQRQEGLSMMLGSAAVAALMGPDEAMATVATTVMLGVCLNCAMNDLGALTYAAEKESQATDAEVPNG